MKPSDFTEIYDEPIDERTALKQRILEAERKSCETLGKPYTEPKPNPVEGYRERIRKTIERSQSETPADEFASIRPMLATRNAKPKKEVVHKANHNKRTVDHWKELGFKVHDVQWHDRVLNRSHDLLGFGDYMAMKDGEPAIMIQVTSKEHESDHVAKIQGLKAAQQWLGTGNRIVLSLWRKSISMGGAISYDYSETEIV